MRIGFVTPFNNRSAIGRGNRPVIQELVRRGHEVVVIMADETPPPPGEWLEAPCPIVFWQDVDPVEMAHFRTLIVHLGDHYPYHAGAYSLLDPTRAIGVFHDLCMYNFFRGWLQAAGPTAELHDAEVLKTYGEAARPYVADARTWALDLGEITRHIPMVEWLASRCAGALAHARHYVGRLEAVCPGPVATAALPWQPRDVAPPPRRRPGEKLTVATVGMMNPNKCAAEVIEAIAGSDVLRDRVTYSLIGSIQPRERGRLETLAQRLGYRGLVIHGAVDDETLEARLAEADIVCCLRKPILEGASGSLIEALQSARPVIVADAGVYGEVPDELALKVPASVPPPAIAAHLERLADDEGLRLSMGESAARWARETFTAEGYVDALEPLIEASVAARPMLTVGAQLGRELDRIGLRRDDPAAGRILAQIADALPAAPPPVAG